MSAAPGGGAGTAAETPPGARPVTRTLVVDDHPIVRQGIVALLAGADDFAVVGQAADGAEAVRLSAELAPDLVVVRCAQEALANVRRHSGSATARVTLRRDGDDAVLTVVDHGTGFDPAVVRDGFGLEGLAERLALAGGSLDLQSGAGGTTLTARLPLAAVAA